MSNRKHQPFTGRHALVCCNWLVTTSPHARSLTRYVDILYVEWHGILMKQHSAMHLSQLRRTPTRPSSSQWLIILRLSHTEDMHSSVETLSLSSYTCVCVCVCVCVITWRRQSQWLVMMSRQHAHLWDPCFFCSRTNSLEFTARLSEGSSCRLRTI